MFFFPLAACKPHCPLAATLIESAIPPPWWGLWGLCLAIYIYFSCKSPNENQVIVEPVGTWGWADVGTYLQPKGSSPALAVEIDWPAVEGTFWRPCKEGPAPCVSALAPPLLSALPIGWILLGQAQSVPETRVPVLFTQSSGGVCLAVVPNSWDYEEVPPLHMSAQML